MSFFASLRAGEIISFPDQFTWSAANMEKPATHLVDAAVRMGAVITEVEP